jgi:hypothetical protein
MNNKSKVYEKIHRKSRKRMRKSELSQAETVINLERMVASSKQGKAAYARKMTRVRQVLLLVV